MHLFKTIKSLKGNDHLF